MNDFDQATRYAVKIAPPEFFAWVLPGVMAEMVFRGWGDTRTLPFPGEPDRICDTVAEFVHPTEPGRSLRAIVEFQSRPEGDMLYRADEYQARLLRELRLPPEELERRPVVVVLVNLTGPEQPSQFTMRAPGHPDIGSWLGARVVTLRGLDAAQILAAIEPGVLGISILAWVSLMRGGGNPVIIQRWMQVATREQSLERRRLYAALAIIFADLAGCQAEWKTALEDWNVNESTLGAALRRSAALETKRQDLLRALQLRYPPAVPADLSEAAAAITDLEELDRWFDAAVTAPSLEAFRMAIQAQPVGRT
jgi:hypothetical protein